MLIGILRGLALLLTAVLSTTSFGAAPVCAESLRGLPPISVNNRASLAPEHIEEMLADGKRAAGFAQGHFTLPAEISINAYQRNDQWNFPHYSASSDRITATYEFGKKRNGQFIPIGRRHARDIFYHEFGHLLFRHNVGTYEHLIEVYRSGVAAAVANGKIIKSFDDRMLRVYIEAYDELFADIFAVTLSQNPRAMAVPENFFLRETDLTGLGVPKISVLRARDFLYEIPVETWTLGQPHVALAPVRSAFRDDPFVADLLKNRPAELARLALDAIHFELKKLFTEDVEILPEMKLQEFNRRMIQVMKEFLREKQEKESVR